MKDKINSELQDNLHVQALLLDKVCYGNSQDLSEAKDVWNDGRWRISSSNSFYTWRTSYDQMFQYDAKYL
jgi:hypothetical protein